MEVRYHRPTTRFRWFRWEAVLIIASVLASLVFAGAMIWTASIRPLSGLETVLFQILVLFVGLAGGLYGSYKFGKASAEQAGKDVIRPHARSALRSVMVLNDNLIELHEPIERIARDTADERVAMLHHMVNALNRVAVSAINDWRDVIPEDFQDIGETVVHSITTEGEGTD